MRQVGIVKEIFKDCAIVEVSRKSACEGCHANKDGNCSACISLGKKEMITKAENSIGASAGDRVLVETESRRVLTYAAAVFLLPLIFGVVGYCIGGLIPHVWAPYIGAVLGFLIVFLVSCIILNHAASRRLDVRIIRIL